MIVQRALVLVAAVAAVAWLAVSYGDARLIRHAQVAAADPKAGAAELESALADARGAGSGAEPLAYQASLNIRLHRLGEARRLLEQLVRREPETPEAWFLIAELTQRSDPALAARARGRLHQLDPLGAPAQP
jgi:hypothetical protein